ncbi:hypothetical protein ASE66_28090 [Bosea sp. Root483D1]|uniref:hypothetical protein n=1 Tax=Bosea sp. Root483D1 TaxID=1736544 RepID=UPI00070D5617|nr:hypothetical protein [Bosea sp. Root483D1]KRE21710.1 hypothetical protein ASE66_28090 [Bosea sp. Root483D1]
MHYIHRARGFFPFREMGALSRYWRSELSDREFSMLAYIMDHTVEWGRLAYRFTYRSLAEGTPISPVA